MAKQQLVRVYPDPALPPGTFLPGVGEDGADVHPDRAAEWIEAGLATTTRPRLSSSAKPRRSATNATKTPPATSPAEQPASPAKE
jgi:hypothetical protein